MGDSEPKDRYAAREVIVLLPGHMCDARLWSHQAASLARLHDVRVMPLHATEGGIGQLAANVLASVKGRFAVAGFSMGGYVALDIVRTAPQRITRLALLNTSARPDTDFQRERRLAKIERVRRGQLQAVASEFAADVLGPAARNRPVVADAVRRMFHATSADHFIAQQMAMIDRADARDVLASVSCPTAILCGCDDQVIPMEAQLEMRSLAQGACLEVLAGAGHMSPMEQPELVSAFLAHWMSQPGAPG